MCSTTSESAKLETFLANPENYPHQPEEVKIIHTHASVVALAPPWVYKMKKPVDLGFMDFTSPEKRRNNAIREITLNRRLAPEIYHSIVPVYEDDKAGEKFGEEFTDPENVPVKFPDYAVKMKMLEKNWFFKELMRRDEITYAQLDRIIEALVNFYQHQDPGNEVLKYGTMEAVRENTMGNFLTLYEYIGETLTQPAYDAVKYFTERFFENNEERFEKRIKEKHILDCHGDLHLEHIHLHPERLSIYDCIEFNDRFRYIDVANDIAFLAMDLDYHNKSEWAGYIVSLIANMRNDHDLPGMVNFYKVYRACVRGKVESIKSSEPEVPKEDRNTSHKKAVRHLELALHYAVAGPGPYVLLVMGNIATGKSTLAKNLASILNWPHYNSDVIRKELAGLPPEKPAPEEEKGRIYSEAFNQKVYNTLLDKMKEAWEQGRGVVLDATFGKQEMRKQFMHELEKLHVPFCFAETYAPRELIIQRLEERSNESGQPSDARREDFEKLYDKFEPAEDIERKHYVSVNTALTMDENLSRLLKALTEKHA